MRVVLFAMLLSVAIGCSKRDSAPLNVQVTQPEPTPEVKPVPPVPPDEAKPPPPKSLLKLDFANLWEQTGPKRLSPEEQERQHHGRVVYADHADECLAGQVVGGGLAGPVAVIARLRIQSDVLKRVRAASEEPPSIRPTGGLLASGEFGGRRLTLISVVEKQPEARDRFRDFMQIGVVPVVAKATGSPTRLETRHGVVSITRIPFKTSDRSGTITLALVFPNTEKKALDELIPPDDVVGRSLLAGHREGDTLLIAIVDEQ
ncbi:MAG: hypothetical protein K8U57_03040 [Planctomycetes bacterium]|nr:hypothetical protein [Planctomycetota bacterium]